MTLATQDKHDAYATHQRQHLTDREIEARALLSCARLLEEARSSGNRQTYADALQRNQRLWTIFQVAMCDPTNPLPNEIKSLLLSLSRYVDKVSFSAAAQFNPSMLGSLIDINRRIAAGLSKKPEGAQLATTTMLPTNVPMSTSTSA